MTAISPRFGGAYVLHFQYPDALKQEVTQSRDPGGAGLTLYHQVRQKAVEQLANNQPYDSFSVLSRETDDGLLVNFNAGNKQQPVTLTYAPVEGLKYPGQDMGVNFTVYLVDDGVGATPALRQAATSYKRESLSAQDKTDLAQIKKQYAENARRLDVQVYDNRNVRIL